MRSVITNESKAKRIILCGDESSTDNSGMIGLSRLINI